MDSNPIQIEILAEERQSSHFSRSGVPQTEIFKEEKIYLKPKSDI